MIECRLHAVLLQPSAYLRGALPAPHIHYGASPHAAQYMQHLAALVCGMPHDVGKVLALETHAEHVAVLELQLLLNVVGDLSCSRCSEREQRCLRFYLPDVGNVEV